MQSEPGCVFCDIVHGEAHAQVVFQDDLVTAFMDINPVNPGHLLVVPNTHAASIQQVADEACGRMFVIGRDLDKALRLSGLRCEAVNLYLADGRDAGQAVFHAHLHVIPRFAGDSCGLRLHAGMPESPSSDEFSDQAAEVANALRQVHSR